MTNSRDEATAEPEQPSETPTTEHGVLVWGPGVQTPAEDRELWPLRAGYSAT